MSHYKSLIDKLTKHQQNVLGNIAINLDTGHNPRTLKTLTDLGLIQSYKEDLRSPGQLTVTITRYYVPLPIHIKWCAWCSDQFEKAEKCERCGGSIENETWSCVCAALDTR
jgi:hypothetical protein